MTFDDQAKGVGRRAIQSQSLGYIQRQLSAGTRVLAGAMSLACIMQQKRQIKHKGLLNLLEQLDVIVEGRLFGVPDLVELFDANQCVLVRSVLMIKLMLNQTGKLPELGQVLSQETHFMHKPENPRHIATLV